MKSIKINKNHSLLDTLYKHCVQIGINKTYWIAYSGGLDSSVLLSLCAKLSSQFAIQFRAIHINHLLSPHAASWILHCKKVCEDYAIDLMVHTITLDHQSGDSLEELARQKRYAAFATQLALGDVLLTAHHQDDQAETILLQLLRGAGLKGLAGMPELKVFAQGWHCRPLLHYSRFDLQQYAENIPLKWIEDESNTQLKFRRNYIRHEILSRLKTYWPTAAGTMARSAAHCAKAQNLLETFGSELYASTTGINPHTLSVTKLKKWNGDQQCLILRQWIHQHGYALPSLKKIKTIQHNVLTAGEDKLPQVSWEKIEIRRYGDDLYLMKQLSKHHSQNVYSWDLMQSLKLPGIGQLHSSAPTLGRGIRADLSLVTVRFRQGGESINLPKRGRHTLKNLFQEWRVLPWERDRIPLIFVADQLISILGYFIDVDFIAKSTELGREIWLEK